MRPNFLIIGAGKSGTTSLWNYLGQHPDIGMSAIKEPSFFSIDQFWGRGWGWYERLFEGCQGKKAVGEASNSYSALGIYPETLERIADNLENVKIIYCVRHPVTRSESDWMEKNLTEPVTFSDFLRKDAVYYDKNKYLRTYNAYEDKFGAENILVLFFEELVENPKPVVERCLRFLDVSTDAVIEVGASHGVTGENRVLFPGIRAIVQSNAYAGLGLYVPTWLKQLLKPLLSKSRSAERPKWSDSDYEWFREQFEGESKRFLEVMGHPDDFWEW